MRTGTATPGLDRLAELVTHLSGCPAGLAVTAVNQSLDGRRTELSTDERLTVVAEALLAVRHDSRRQVRRSA